MQPERRLEFIYKTSRSACANCPAFYEVGGGGAVIQGYVVDTADGAVPPGARGKLLIRVPPDILGWVAMALLTEGRFARSPRLRCAAVPAWAPAPGGDVFIWGAPLSAGMAVQMVDVATNETGVAWTRQVFGRQRAWLRERFAASDLAEATLDDVAGRLLAALGAPGPDRLVRAV